MSKVEVTFAVRNQGNQSCLLQGTPVVEFRDGHGERAHFTQPSPPESTPGKASRLLLESGKSAQFSVSFGTSNGFAAGQCPARAAEMLVNLPKKGGTGTVKVDFDICTKPRISPFSLSDSR